jgi:hypothetical protein
LVINGAQVTPDYVFEEGYPLETIEEHADFMWENKHLPGLPGAAANKNGVEIVSHQFGTLEELEKAHIYISQLNGRLKVQNEELKSQAESLEAQDEALSRQERRIAQLELALAEVLRNQSPGVASVAAN